MAHGQPGLGTPKSWLPLRGPGAPKRCPPSGHTPPASGSASAQELSETGPSGRQAGCQWPDGRGLLGLKQTRAPRCLTGGAPGSPVSDHKHVGLFGGQASPRRLPAKGTGKGTWEGRDHLLAAGPICVSRFLSMGLAQGGPLSTTLCTAGGILAGVISDRLEKRASTCGLMLLLAAPTVSCPPHPPAVPLCPPPASAPAGQARSIRGSDLPPQTRVCRARPPPPTAHQGPPRSPPQTPTDPSASLAPSALPPALTPPFVCTDVTCFSYSVEHGLGR